MDELRLVRPLVGAAAALALVVGGLSAFTLAERSPEPAWNVNLMPMSTPMCTHQCPAGGN